MKDEFLIDINPDINLPKHELILCKLNEEPLQQLENIINLNYKTYYVGIDELSFDIPLYRTDPNGDKVRNEIYDLIDGEYLILVNDMKYFIIDDVSEKASDDSEVYKSVHCYSREYELIHKKIVDYKADSRVLYDNTNSTLGGLEAGILNYVFNHITKSWTIGYVDPDLILREGKGVYRALDFPDNNLIQVFQELQKTYSCIFRFNTIEQKVDVYDISSIAGQHRGLYISDENFLKSISKNIKYDEVKTRLYLYGQNNVSIQSVSPVGQPYIDNFDVYKNTRFMSQTLIDALNDYEEKIENYSPNFEPLLQQLQEGNARMEELYNFDSDVLEDKGLVALQRHLSVVQTMIDTETEEKAIIQNRINKAEEWEVQDLHGELGKVQKSLNELLDEKDEVEALITNKENEISEQQIIIDSISEQIKVLQSELNVNNDSNFTEQQLKELDNFIRVERYSNSDYTEHNIQELYDEGIKTLSRISQPRIQFSADVVDFLKIIECQHVWDKFKLGDIVTLEHSEIGFNFDVMLVECEHDDDNNKLNLKFSNRYNYDDADLYLRDLVEDVNTTGAVVDFYKDEWNKAGTIESVIAKAVDSKLEDARQNILNAVGQRYLFNDNGLWLYKENPDNTINDAQIRAINNTIALTEDNWATVGTAITPRGIVAENIYGKLGAFAQVSANQILVGGENGRISFSGLRDKPDISEESLQAWSDSGYATYIDKDGIYTGTVTANQLKIGGENGSISFVDLSDKPTIPPAYSDTEALNAWLDSGYATYINSNGIYTGTLSANKILIGGTNGSISFNDLSNKPWIPQNADDVGARPDDWVPTWAEVKDSPTILSADDIKTTVITKDWIGTLGLLVGDEIQMGTNARISWANVDGKPTIPPAYSDTKALNAWLDSGYATHINSNGIYTGTIAANKILIGGTNGSISFTDLSNKPYIPENADDVGAKPADWVPTWAEIKNSPTVLSANDIKTTVITKEWIGTLGLMVGNEIKMGSNAIITWDNLSEDSKVNLKGEDGRDGVDGSDGVDGKDGSDANVPNYITSTKITSTTIESPNITGGTLIGGTIRTSTSNRRVQMNSLGIRSYNSSNQRHGFGLNTYGELELYNGGSNVGSIRFDTSGTSPDAANRMFITTTDGYAMKLQSAGDMSIESSGDIWIHGNIKFATVDARREMANSLGNYVIKPYYPPTNFFYADLNSAQDSLIIRNASGTMVGRIPLQW